MFGYNPRSKRIDSLSTSTVQEMCRVATEEIRKRQDHHFSPDHGGPNSTILYQKKRSKRTHKLLYIKSIIIIIYDNWKVVRHHYSKGLGAWGTGILWLQPHVIQLFFHSALQECSNQKGMEWLTFGEIASLIHPHIPIIWVSVTCQPQNNKDK